MITLAERKVLPVRKYTEARFLCTTCKRNDNFELVVKQEGSLYFLGEKCPKCEHFEDFREITKKEASRYLLLEDLP